MFDERERYAEEMKQALLRGVCALNIETMSVFGQQGQGPDTLPDPHVMPANDELPFRTDEDEQQRFRATLKTSIPHKDPTWFNHQTLQEQRQQAANALATAQEQRAASPAASSRLVSHYAHIPAPQVLPHRHVSDYASLHQPPPPPPSLLRHPNPGSLHVVDQYADSRGVTTASPEVAPVQAQAPSARTASPARAPRARSPDHGNIYHNFKNSSVGAGVPHSTAGSARATGRVIRPVVEQARGPIGLVTVRGNGKPASAAGGASRSIRVERHGRP